jgi:hypothetical protein
MYGRTRGRSSDHGHKARANGLADGNSKMQCKDGSQQDAASNTRQRSQESREESQQQERDQHVELDYHSRRGGRFSLLVRMVAGADHRPRLDVAEAEAQRFLPQLAELLRRVEPRYGKMIARRP